MATIVNDADVQLQATSPRLITITMPSNTQVDFSAVTGATKPSNNADVTTTILTASGTSIVMTNSQLFKSSSGVGGVFIGSGGLIGKDGSGATTFSINATTGAVTFTGSITGGSTLAITGTASFDGVTSGAVGTTAVSANVSGSSDFGVTGSAGASNASGIYGYHGGVSGAHGVRGLGKGTGNGVWGSAGTGTDTGAGVLGSSILAGAPGMRASNIGGGNALEVKGNLSFDNASSTGASLASLASNKPGSASTFTWIPCTVNGVSGWLPWAPN